MKRTTLYFIIAFVVIIGAVYALTARISFFRNKTPEGIVSSQLNRNKISNKDLVGITRRKIPYEPPVAAKKEPRHKLAIILDDWGYNTKNLEGVLEMNIPLTLSILPGLPYSTFIANKAKERNMEVILHMPMEPEAKIRLEADTLYLSMDRQEIISRIDAALESVPHAKGVSNHEGSKATADEKLMRIIFEELKSRQLFFVDSFVTNKSVCEELAKEMKVRFLKRSVFLDNKNDASYIKGQIEKAIELAGKGEGIVAIGHDKPNTITAIREMLPRLAENDIALVCISELASPR